VSFIVRNEAFICQFCGEENPPAVATCRNHCRKCLFSEHVDETSPGDRAASCHGKMVPIAVEQSGKKGWILVHECHRCRKTTRNKVAADDNFDEFLKLAERQGRENSRRKK
jgi:hypothetical protein